MSDCQIRPSPPGIENLASLIQAEFNEMPGMHLTFAQVRRLWNLSSHDCETILDYLLSIGMLRQDDDDRFCRLE